MNEEKQKKEGMFRTFWTKIEDLESAQVAASGGAAAAGYLAFSYAISLLYLYFSGETLFGELNEQIFNLLVGCWYMQN